MLGTVDSKKSIKPILYPKNVLILVGSTQTNKQTPLFPLVPCSTHLTIYCVAFDDTHDTESNNLSMEPIFSSPYDLERSSHYQY